jgi:DNA repair exonuclease SbcCD nuclease subunit
MVRFIHTADWQIGMKAAHVGAVGKRVRSERLESARRVVDAANSRQADFIIVAGDTFEDNAVDRVLVQKVADILARFDGPVYLTPGNHDPLVSGSVWEHAAWQSHSNLNVITEAKPIELDEATIYPCPLFEKHSLADPTSWIDASGNPKISIGIGHGTVEGIAQAEPDYPIPRDAASRSGLDYLGIGHWHSYGPIPSTDGVVRLAYSGTHETTKFGERDSGNALLVEITGRGSAPVIESIRTGGLEWKVIEESLTDVGDAARVREQIESLSDAGKSLVDLRIWRPARLMKAGLMLFLAESCNRLLVDFKLYLIRQSYLIALTERRQRLLHEHSWNYTDWFRRATHDFAINSIGGLAIFRINCQCRTVCRWIKYHPRP